MIDPISAITMATSAYNMVTKMVAAGREFEDTAQQLGKWYTAVGDFRFGQQQAKNPPLFRRLVSSKSIEEEALNLLIHEKKIAEQEKELRTMLMWRYGANAWDELVQMRRKIAKTRQDTVYRQAELRKDFFNTISILLLVVGCLGIIGGMGWFIGDVKGFW
jgi:hypothetical protein|tara:strand:+ start:120 stop:602 length:483 start_codon:yes stop_codon:yes gene_type:complete